MRCEVAEHEAAHRRSAQLLAEAQARQLTLRQCVEQMAEDSASALRDANAEVRGLRLQLHPW